MNDWNNTENKIVCFRSHWSVSSLNNWLSYLIGIMRNNITSLICDNTIHLKWFMCPWYYPGVPLTPFIFLAITTVARHTGSGGAEGGSEHCWETDTEPGVEAAECTSGEWGWWLVVGGGGWWLGVVIGGWGWWLVVLATLGISICGGLGL